MSGTLGLYLIEARAGAEPRKVTDFFAPNKTSLSWTQDGTRLLYSTGLEPRLNGYIQDRLTVVSVSDGKPHVLTERSRPSRQRSRRCRRMAGACTPYSRTTAPKCPSRCASILAASKAGFPENYRQRVCAAAAGASRSWRPPTTRYLKSMRSRTPALRKLTAHNDGLMKELSLSAVDDISFPSRDGTVIHGLMVKPRDYQVGKLYPTVIWIHGGPNGQDSHGLPAGTYSPELERQWFAAHGYVVLAVNYRGSSGRGAAFARSIAADWGDKEVADLLAGADYVVREKIADPRRLGIGGWSYGGILTDYTIASDTRFKAAISGAGSGNQLSMYRQSTSTSCNTTRSWGRRGGPWSDGSRCRIPSFMPIESKLRPCSWAGTRISTCRLRAASKCTRRCARWAFPPSSWCTRGKIMSLRGRAISRTVFNATSSGSTATSNRPPNRGRDSPANQLTDSAIKRVLRLKFAALQCRKCDSSPPRFLANP